jgi:hypothetical protein
VGGSAQGTRAVLEREELLSALPDRAARWLASAGDDRGVRLWPVPDVSRTPFHRKPHAGLLAALRTHTNLRAIADAKAPGGYKLQPDPFPGWAKPPEW